MSIKTKGEIEVIDGHSDDLQELIKDLHNGKYKFYICDNKKNRSLSQNKYLFGVVLKVIASETGEDVNRLYKYFEQKYSEPIVVDMAGEEVVVFDMKRQSSQKMNEIIEKIRLWASEELNVKIPTREEMKSPECQELYVDAYNEKW